MSGEPMENELWQDPIVEEVRETRRRILQSCDGDLKKLANLLIERQESSGRQVVRAPTRPAKTD